MGEMAQQLWAAAVPGVRFNSTHQLVQSQGGLWLVMTSTDHMHKMKDIHAGKIVIHLWFNTGKQTIKQKTNPTTLQNVQSCFQGKWSFCLENRRKMSKRHVTHTDKQGQSGLQQKTQQRASETERSLQSVHVCSFEKNCCAGQYNLEIYEAKAKACSLHGFEP